MARKKSSKNTDVRKIPVKTDISSVEAETIKRADRTISAIEKFLSRWDSSEIRNNMMIPQIEKVRNFHDALVDWRANAVKSHKGEDDKERLQRLQEFVTICQRYS